MIFRVIFAIVLICLSADLIETQGMYQGLISSLTKLNWLGQ